MATNQIAVLCPGQGAQVVGMGRTWHETSDAAQLIFAEADHVLAASLGLSLSEMCFSGPVERLNQTDASQPAIFACSVASFEGSKGQLNLASPSHAAGLSLGEYTALHLAGVFDFATGLRLVAKRGQLMQQAAISSQGGMVALIGADENQAQLVCDQAAQKEVLVCANFNAPGQIVLSGHLSACARAVGVATELGLKAAPLAVAGAFHSPLMQPAADEMGEVLAKVDFQRPKFTVWSNVTAQPHDPDNLELLKARLVEQIVSPVQWSRSCQALIASGSYEYHELAPGSVLRGLMRRIDRNIKVQSHEEPES